MLVRPCRLITRVKVITVELCIEFAVHFGLQIHLCTPLQFYHVGIYFLTQYTSTVSSNISSLKLSYMY